MVNCEGCGRKRLWSISRHCLRLFLEGLMKTTRNINYYGRLSGRGSKPVRRRADHRPVTSGFGSERSYYLFNVLAVTCVFKIHLLFARSLSNGYEGHRERPGVWLQHVRRLTQKVLSSYGRWQSVLYSDPKRSLQWRSLVSHFQWNKFCVTDTVLYIITLQGVAFILSM
jgi:hypothetical protein